MVAVKLQLVNVNDNGGFSDLTVNEMDGGSTTAPLVEVLVDALLSAVMGSGGLARTTCVPSISRYCIDQRPPGQKRVTMSMKQWHDQLEVYLSQLRCGSPAILALYVHAPRSAMQSRDYTRLHRVHQTEKRCVS